VDPRLALGLTSVAGAFAGAAVMFATAPDTGVMPAPVVVEEAATTEAFAPEPAAPVPAAAAVPPRPPAPQAAGEPEVDPFLGLPVAGDPWQTAGENPFGDGAPPSTPPRPSPRAGMVPEGGPYPSDVRGVRQLFMDREQDVKDCMTNSGPNANPGEVAVMLRLHLKSDPGSSSGGAIEKVEAVQDADGRYQYFLSCVQEKFAGAPIQAPPAGTSMVHWSVRR
jgi:hypothetical protein